MGKDCARCGEPIKAQFAYALDQFWHPDCLLCASCKEPIGAKAFVQEENHAYHPGCFAEEEGEVCARCGKPILGDVMCALDKEWHPRCFRCQECNRPIGAHPFGVRPADNAVVHEKCPPPEDCESLGASDEERNIEEAAEVVTLPQEVLAEISTSGDDSRTQFLIAGDCDNLFQALQIQTSMCACPAQAEAAKLASELTGEIEKERLRAAQHLDRIRLQALRKQEDLQREVEASKGDLEALLKVVDVDLEALQGPQGRVTLAFTDIQGSTALWESDPTNMKVALDLHNTLFRQEIKAFHGFEVKTEGDAFMVAFSSAVEAVQWALKVQSVLLAQPWAAEILEKEEAKVVPAPDEPNQAIFRGLRVRMGLHVGNPESTPDPITTRTDYFGPMVNMSARISGLAHGGEIAVSQTFLEEIKGEGALATFGGVAHCLGPCPLKGIKNPETCFLLYPKQLSSRMEYFKTLRAGKQQAEAASSGFSPEKLEAAAKKAAATAYTKEALAAEVLRLKARLSRQSEEVASMKTLVSRENMRVEQQAIEMDLLRKQLEDEKAQLQSQLGNSSVTKELLSKIDRAVAEKQGEIQKLNKELDQARTEALRISSEVQQRSQQLTQSMCAKDASHAALPEVSPTNGGKGRPAALQKAGSFVASLPPVSGSEADDSESPEGTSRKGRRDRRSIAESPSEPSPLANPGRIRPSKEAF